MKKLKLETTGGQSSAHITKFSDDGSISLKKKNKKKSKFKIQDSEISTTTYVKQELPVPIDKIKIEKNESNNIRVKLSALWLNYKPRSTTLIKSGITWFEQLKEENLDEDIVDTLTKKELKDIASKILSQDAENYKKIEERNSKKGDMDFRKTVYNVGTFRDKLAAHVLRCMESPAHSLHNLNAIIMMISPKAKNEFEEALDSVQKLLDYTLLPDKRVARKFEDHKFSCLLPLVTSNREQAEKQLALWYFEDQLLIAYRRLISQLSQVTSNTVDNTKIIGIKSLVSLVTKHPGQDTEIVLEAIINKLGDPSRKVASQTMFSLHRFINQCPHMKNLVVSLVEILLYRSNVTPKTQYFSLCYLKDIIFKTSESKLAAKLLKLYIGFFKACTKKGEVDTRMMSALLRGINRAFPFSRLQGDALQDQLQTLYKLCHIVNFAVATQALQLIYQVVTSKDQVEDRFYQALYGQMQDPTFGSSTGSAAFLNLVFKAMMRDDSLERRQAFVKRLLQVAQYQAPHLICGMLFLVSEITKEKADMKGAIQTVLQCHVESNDVDDFETFEDIDEADSDPDDVKDVKEECDSVEEGSIKRESDDFEQDLHEVGDAPCTKLQSSMATAPTSSSWFHRTNNFGKVMKRNYYDPYLRSPQYSGAHFTSLWELLLLQAHYHPSVALFAEKIITEELISYSGDPLQDFTLIRFLDRFVYKNPKKDVEKMNPSAVTLGSRAYYTPDGARGIAVNSEDFIKLEGQEVPEDQQFFHSYFTKYKVETKKKKDDDDDDDVGSVDDDEFDEYLNKISGVGSDDDSDIDENIDFSAGTSGTPKGSAQDAMESDEDVGGSDEEPVFEGYSDDSDGGGESGSDGEEMDFDEENVAFSDDDDFDGSSTSAKKKGKPKKKVKNASESLDSMFASADDFAHLLEENAEDDAGLPTATSKELANKDQAHVKQLNWEVDRNDRLRDSGRYGNRGQWKKRGQNRPSRGSQGQNRSSRGFGGQKHSKNVVRGAKNKFKVKSKNFKAKKGRRK
ncbi:CCAAT/enhancer-binding protein zeta-like [Palaemon carinicauda]|uniref:CCAAT/enhancer-binding protein zeta-like n=1 Tax=Palaemon carinicauda TaxID=392227 RepID=UPI0035B6A0E6